MLCYMHEASPYGYLKVGHKVILPDNLARMVGATLPEVEGLLKDLEDAEVFSRDENGHIYSRRLIRDEEIRRTRAAGGFKGGNPLLKSGMKDNHTEVERLTSEDKQKPTPSSSLSSSSSTQDNTSSELPFEEPTRFSDDTTEYRLASLLRESILTHLPNARAPKQTPSSLAKWSQEMDRLLRIDGRTVEDVEDMIAWSQTHDFWRTVILSAKKFREKWDTMDGQRRRSHTSPQTFVKPASRPIDEFDWSAHLKETL